MRSVAARWGNSLALILPQPIADQTGFAEGTPVEIEFEDGCIVIRPAAPRYTLDNLLVGITVDNLPDQSLDD